MPVWHLCLDLFGQLNSRTSWHSSTTVSVLPRQLGTNFQQAPDYAFSRSVYRVTHVSSEFQKDGDVDTSLVSDPARGDPYNERLVPAAPEKMIYI